MQKKTALTGISVLIAVVAFVIGISLDANSTSCWVMATTVLMASLWITEAIPMGATALLPIAIFPLAGVADVKEIAPLYGNHIVFLFVAGFLLAFAMERWNLHQRLAYKIIQLIGFSQKRILLGFIAAAFILSMWINNTAATIVLLAPALAIIKEFQSSSNPETKFPVALLLGICYASSIGGIVTPIGTAPNLILKATYESSFPDSAQLGFFNWIIFALPVALVFAVVMFFILSKKIKGTGIGNELNDLKDRIQKLKSFSYEEIVILVAFCILIILWMTAQNVDLGSITIKGWKSWFENGEYIRDSAIGMFIALLLFFIPAANEKRNILEWKDAERLPFGILFIFGGGFAISKGFQISGLDRELTVLFEGFSSVPVFALIFFICLIMTFLTEITSNTATTQLFLPLLVILVNATGIDPLYLLVPAAFSASFAFMLPVATPPNAIVFGTDLVANRDMMRTGIWLNLIGVILLSTYTYFFSGLW